MYMGLLLILNCLISYLDAANSMGYGVVRIKVESIELCRGPKRRDCCVPNITIDKEGHKITYNLLVKENLILTSGKMVATAEGKEVMKYHMKKPCDHFLIRTLLKIDLNVSDNCGVLKGHYIYDLDVQAISKKYYGNKFFYGNFTIRTNFAADACNFLCTMMQIVMTPIKI